MEITLILFISVIVISLFCEFIDASVGMGYGTSLTPILLIMGFGPLQVVSAVLLGQMVGGFLGGISHYRFKNVKLDSFKSDDAKVIFILAGFGIIGALIAVFFAVNIPSIYLKTYIGLMVFCIGIYIIIRRNNEDKTSWSKLIFIAILGAFNKGSSGGGYGPLVTGGQLISGRNSKNSVGVTTIAETVICIVAFIGYLFTSTIFWKLAFATSIGSIVAGPLAAFTVSKVNEKNLKIVIGIITCILGILTLLKTYIF